MTVTLLKTVNNIQTVANPKNVHLILGFSRFMKSSGNSERYQNNNLKTIIAFSKHLDTSTTLTEEKKSREEF